MIPILTIKPATPDQPLTLELNAEGVRFLRHALEALFRDEEGKVDLELPDEQAETSAIHLRLTQATGCTPDGKDWLPAFAARFARQSERAKAKVGGDS